MSDLTQLLTAAVEAVADAARVCRLVQSNMGRVKALVKDDQSPVTVADFASQAIVARRLRERLDRIILVAEETSSFLRNPVHEGHLQATLAAVSEVWPEVTEAELLDAIDDGAGDPHHPSFWTLDPIDGTKGFLRGEQYAVALAYIAHGEPVIGVLAGPSLPRDLSLPLDRPDRHGSLYFCLRGQGVYELAADRAKDHPVKVMRPEREAGEPVRVCASVEKAHSNISDTDRVMERVDPKFALVQLDSQCKYAVVARGQADAYLRLPTKKGYVERIWDHAAGALIAHEAGCAVTDILGEPLDFSRGRGLERNRGILAAPPADHGRILGAIKALGIG